MLTPEKTPPALYLRYTQSLRFFGALIATCTLPALVMAADNPGAHEHGQAQLQMAVDVSEIELMFSSPAYNLAGFEHQARTGDEKAQLAEIDQWLETTPLINTETGDCKVTAATVQLGGDTGAQDEDEQGHGGHHHHGDHHGDHDAEEASHRDYEVTQQLNCEGLNRDDVITSPLPERFPELEELTVEWAGPTGQGSTLITPSARRFTLDQ